LERCIYWRNFGLDFGIARTSIAFGMIFAIYRLLLNDLVGIFVDQVYFVFDRPSVQNRKLVFNYSREYRDDGAY
jgi:hypothetical protein